MRPFPAIRSPGGQDKMIHKFSLYNKILIRWVILLLLAFLLLSGASTFTATAQSEDLEPALVTAISKNVCGGQDWIVTINFWNLGAQGGEQYAQATIIGDNCINGKLTPTPFDAMYGTFSGGRNGVFAFERCSGSSSSKKCEPIQFELEDGKQVTYQGQPLYIVQNPEAFDGKPITPEYIFTTYGIQVEDTIGDGEWEASSWSPQELRLLNEVLKELPPGMIKRMALTRIIRSKVKLESNGYIKPSVLGTYYVCDSPPDPDCSASSGTIRIFDAALKPNSLGYFSDDPQARKQFKYTIMHEMTHALQYYKDGNSINRNPYNSPMMENFQDAVRYDTDINKPGFFGYGNSWFYGEIPGQPPPRWFLNNLPEDNKPPTQYGITNPMEDMSESTAMYVYDPARLKASSMKRYNFIRDFVFGGVEYENGFQKKQ
jgi:hypothetical protein